MEKKSREDEVVGVWMKRTNEKTKIRGTRGDRGRMVRGAKDKVEEEKRKRSEAGRDV